MSSHRTSHQSLPSEQLAIDGIAPSPNSFCAPPHRERHPRGGGAIVAGAADLYAPAFNCDTAQFIADMLDSNQAVALSWLGTLDDITGRPEE